MSSTVDLIHRQLEFLKYVGGTRKREDGSVTPSGRGVEVNVVVLPDLLLDFRQYNLEPRGQDRPPGQVCAVGGRAARMACVLQHLLGDDDGTFQVHLLTRTGNLGRLLLENEFYRDPCRRGARIPFLEHVLPRDGEPRCALRPDPREPVKSQRPRKADELSRQDLNSPELSRLIARANAVCLSSIKTPDFEGILRHLVNAMGTPPCQGLFIDSRRATKNEIEHLKAELGSSPATRAKIAALFVRGEEQETFRAIFGGRTIQEAAENCRFPIICYGSGKEVSWLYGDGQSFTADCTAPLRNEGISECFKAGILLAWSVYSAVQGLRKSHSGLYDCLHDEWPRDLNAYWRNVLEYGAVVARARSDGEISCKLSDLLRIGGAADTEHLPVPPFQPQGLVRTEPTRGPNRRLVLDQPAVPKNLAMLAGWRRISAPEECPSGARPRNAMACRDLAICTQARCQTGCVNAKRSGVVGAVMVDLDGTLMDSTEQRNRALARALMELTKAAGALAREAGTQESLPKPVEEVEATGLAEAVRKVEKPVEFFTENIYNRHDLYNEEGLRLGDFRQKWNHPGWYIAYLVLAQNQGLREELAAGFADELADRKEPWKERFRAEYERVAGSCKEAVRRAQNAFESVPMHPFKEAGDFLRSLQLTGSLSLYVVSEGDPESQWLKLRSTGLDEFFDREHVLTTGDAVEPVEVREALSRERKALALERTHIQDKMDRLNVWSSQLGDVETSLLNAQRNERQDKAINNVFFSTKQRNSREYRRLKRQLKVNLVRRMVGGFVKSVINRMGSKTFLSFYAGAVRAILRRPSAPRSKLVRFSDLLERISSDTKLKFAMVGDRQRNDIRPPSELLKGNVVTVRINSLDYARKEHIDSETRFPPLFVVDTLAQAKAVLLARETWNEVTCVSDPPIFHWTVDSANWRYYPRSPKDSTIGLGYILRGCEMPYGSFPTINQICAGILEEYFVACDSKDVMEETLRPYLHNTLHSRPRVCARASLLCSLVRLKAIYRPPLSGLQLEITKRIAADAESLKDDAEILGEIRGALESIFANGEEEAGNEARRVIERMGWWGAGLK